LYQTNNNRKKKGKNEHLMEEKYSAASNTPNSYGRKYIWIPIQVAHNCENGVKQHQKG
jgi:hypothetical protein